MKGICLECGKQINGGFAAFSEAHFGVPLCLQHQRRLLVYEQLFSPPFLKLYFELRSRLIPVSLRHSKGPKGLRLELSAPIIAIYLDPVRSNLVLTEAFNQVRRDFFSHLGEPEYPVTLPYNLMDRPEHTRNTVDFLIDLLNLPAPLSKGKTPEYFYRPPADRIDYRNIWVSDAEVIHPATKKT